MKLEQDIMKDNIEEIRSNVEQLRADSRDSMLRVRRFVRINEEGFDGGTI